MSIGGLSDGPSIVARSFTKMRTGPISPPTPGFREHSDNPLTPAIGRAKLEKRVDRTNGVNAEVSFCGFKSDTGESESLGRTCSALEDAITGDRVPQHTTARSFDSINECLEMVCARTAGEKLIALKFM